MDKAIAAWALGISIVIFFLDRFLFGNSTSFPLVVFLVFAMGCFFVVMFYIFPHPWIQNYHVDQTFRKTIAANPFPTVDQYLETVLNKYGEKARAEGLTTVDGELRTKLKALIGSLYLSLNFFREPPPYPPFNFSFNPEAVRDFDSYLAVVKYNDHLYSNRELVEELATDFSVNLLMMFTRNLPSAVDSQLGEAPLYELIDTKNVIGHLVYFLFAEDMNAFFGDLQKQINTNRYAVSQSKLTQRKFEDGERINANEFEGSNKEAVDLYLRSTPFKDLFYTPFPFGLQDKERFEHQWVVGAQGTGKTNLLSVLIESDLNRVAKGECSMVVMDSQNELIPQIAHLARFAPQGDLNGKLIYLEASSDYPLALNVFDAPNQKEEFVRSAIDTVDFFLASILKTDATPNMDIVLSYLIPAVMQVPEATIYTLKDLLEPGGYERYQQHFASLDVEVQEWLANRLGNTPGALKITFDAIRTRLDGFAADALFRRMFRAPRSKLNFFQELQTPKVILINTMGGKYKKSVEPFGRLFIAKVFQAAEERMFVNPEHRLPTFFYIDEASDYIAEEERVVKFINKARKQKVGIVLSQQDESDIKSPTVLAAVRRAAIQTRALSPGKASLRVRSSEARTIAVPHVRFDHQERMDEDTWDELLADMRERYCTTSARPSPQQKRDEGQEW